MNDARTRPRADSASSSLSGSTVILVDFSDQTLPSPLCKSNDVPRISLTKPAEERARHCEGMRALLVQGKPARIEALRALPEYHARRFYPTLGPEGQGVWFDRQLYSTLRPDGTRYVFWYPNEAETTYRLRSGQPIRYFENDCRGTAHVEFSIGQSDLDFADTRSPQRLQVLVGPHEAVLPRRRHGTYDTSLAYQYQDQEQLSWSKQSSVSQPHGPTTTRIWNREAGKTDFIANMPTQLLKRFSRNAGNYIKANESIPSDPSASASFVLQPPVTAPVTKRSILAALAWMRRCSVLPFPVLQKHLPPYFYFTPATPLAELVEAYVAAHALQLRIFPTSLKNEIIARINNARPPSLEMISLIAQAIPDTDGTVKCLIWCMIRCLKNSLYDAGSQREILELMQTDGLQGFRTQYEVSWRAAAQNDQKLAVARTLRLSVPNDHDRRDSGFAKCFNGLHLAGTATVNSAARITPVSGYGPPLVNVASNPARHMKPLTAPNFHFRSNRADVDDESWPAIPNTASAANSTVHQLQHAAEHSFYQTNSIGAWAEVVKSSVSSSDHAAKTSIADGPRKPGTCTSPPFEPSSAAKEDCTWASIAASSLLRAVASVTDGSLQNSPIEIASDNKTRKTLTNRENIAKERKDPTGRGVSWEPAYRPANTLLIVPSAANRAGTQETRSRPGRRRRRRREASS